MPGVKAPRCTLCALKPCYRDPSLKGAPPFCPLKAYADVVRESMAVYESDERVRELHRAASLVEKEGYGFWPRVREVAELSRRLGVKRIGVAFCIGLSEEARALDEVLSKWGFEVYSVCCKCGSYDKTEIGLREEDKLRPGSHEAMCNPVLQALLLNRVGTELNVTVGLCVGHDAIFARFSEAPVVCLVAKDRVTGHNPAAALYARRYFEGKLLPQR